MKNPDLAKQVIPTESELKNIIVNYVGKILNPERDRNMKFKNYKDARFVRFFKKN